MSRRRLSITALILGNLEIYTSDIGAPFDCLGVINLTSAAYFALHVFVGSSRQPHHQIRQHDEVVDAKRAAPGGESDEHVNRRRVGPAKGQRVFDAVIIEEEHPVLAPVVADGEEQELPA